jgi:hypothetical protein
VEVTETTAPTYDELRPRKARTSKTFPVHDDLVGMLLAPGMHANHTIGHVMATCSGYAYGHETTVAMIMARLGLEQNHCLRISESVDVMLIRSTAFLVQSRDGRVVILCFRGTEPLNFINWLIDIDVNPGSVPILFPDGKRFTVHGGFYRNVRSIRYEIIRALERALEGSCVLPTWGGMPQAMEKLYITGHSLGGAMAVLMTIMLRTEPSYKDIADRLEATYTFGQPMVGSPGLAKACSDDPSIGDNVFRYVYKSDIIPQLPPTFTDDFAHFGHEYRHTGPEVGGSWELDPSATPQLARVSTFLVAPLSVVARQIRRFRGLKFSASLEHHFPLHYVVALTPPGAITEFGD